jgi:Tol biopolymer transport system component
MKKRIALVVVISLALVLVLAPSIGSAVNTIRCQRHDGIAVWSTRQSFIVPLGNFEVVCPDGSGTISHWIPHQLADDGTVAIAFSPDGSQVAFASFGDPRNSTGVNIYVMNTDGSEISHLLSMGYDVPHLAWSPNEKRLAFDGLLPSGFGIHIADLNCIQAQSNCAAATTYLGEGTEPSWSPDGERIAFEMNMGSRPEASDYDLWVMDADGSNRIDLTPDGFQALTPAWSPDGQLIAFEYSRNPRGIYAMRPDGSGLTFLADGIKPAWSPNSRNVVFVSDRDSNGRRIGWFDSIIPVQSLYMIERDSGMTTRLTHNDSEFIRYFTWLPK